MKKFDLVKAITDCHKNVSNVNHADAFKSALADLTARKTRKVITRKANGGVKTTSLRKRMKSRSKSELKNYVSDAIESCSFDRKAIIDNGVALFAVNADDARKVKSTIATYLSDSKNPRYCSFRSLATVDKNGIFSFVD